MNFVFIWALCVRAMHFCCDRRTRKWNGHVKNWRAKQNNRMKEKKTLSYCAKNILTHREEQRPYDQSCRSHVLCGMNTIDPFVINYKFQTLWFASFFPFIHSFGLHARIHEHTLAHIDTQSTHSNRVHLVNTKQWKYQNDEQKQKKKRKKK